MGDVGFKISEDVIRGIVNEKMKIAIVEAMGGKDQLLEDVIRVYMDSHCDKDGQLSSYSSDNKYKRSDVLIRNMIEGAMKEAMTQYLQKHQSELQAALSKYFMTKAGTNALVKAVAEGFTNSMADKNWQYHFSLNLERPKSGY